MKKLDQELIHKFASDLMFDLTEEEAAMVEHFAPVFERYIHEIQAIDTTETSVMSYPFEQETTWLREDTPSHVLTREEAFKNAPRGNGEYFEIVKVVK